jgi:hypothetical protein
MAGVVDDEDRVATAAAMYDGEASAEDYGDQVKDVMGSDGSGGHGGRGFDEDNDDIGGDSSSDGGSDADNGGNDNDETASPTSTALERAAQR